MGDFQSLYPLKRGLNYKDDFIMDRYDYILKKAKDLFEDSTTTKGIVSKNNTKNI